LKKARQRRPQASVTNALLGGIVRFLGVLSQWFAARHA
jgi:hypothetical protein